MFIYQEGHFGFTKSDGLKRGFQSMDSSDYQIVETISGDPLFLLYSLSHLEECLVIGLHSLQCTAYLNIQWMTI